MPGGGPVLTMCRKRPTNARGGRGGWALLELTDALRRQLKHNDREPSLQET